MRFQPIKTQQTAMRAACLAITQPIIHSDIGAKMQKFFSQGKMNSAAGSLALAALTACGGGGGNNATPGGTTPITISGKVIDGYIRGATVYWDCNSNNQLDAGEISTITTAGGNYTIADKSSAGCELTASVGADAIDESRPYTSGQSYTMKAVPGRSDLITPFSTLIAGQVSSSGVTAAKAEADIASILGINSSLLVDYKANNVDPNAVKLATSAAVIADSLHQNQKNAIFTDGVTKTYDDIKTRFAQTGFVDSISRGLAPFINTYQSISDKLSKLVSGDLNLRLYRKVNFSDPAANNILDVIAVEVNSRNAAKYGAVNWGAFSNDELKNYLKEINRINALPSDSAAQSNIQALQAKRQKLFSDASLRLNKVVGSDGELVGVYGFFTNDPGASMDFALEMVSISIDTVIDVTTIAGTRPPIGRPSDYAKTHKSLNKMLDNFAFMTSAVKCAKASTSIDDSEVDMTAKITTLVGDCGSFFADVAADATTIARTRNVTQAASGAMAAVGGFGSAIDSKQKALMALKMYATALGLVHDVVEPFVKDPLTTRFLAAADLGIQYLNASAAGLELEIAAAAKLDQGTSDAIALYQREVDSAWRSYFISTMQINADFHFEIVDGTLVKPVVTGITPLAIKSGITTTFTVAGRYLPATATLDITFNGCADIQFVSQSAAQHQFTCTPNVAGTLTAVIRTLPGTTPLGSFTVAVSAAPASAITTGPWEARMGDTTKYSTKYVDTSKGYVTYSGPINGWAYFRSRFNTVLPGDNFRLELKAKNDPNLGGWSAYDLDIYLLNDFLTNQFDAYGVELSTRYFAFVGTNGYFNDFFLFKTDAVETGYVFQPGVLSTTAWHTYVLEVTGGVAKLYYDGVLKYSQTYAGKLGQFSTLMLAGKGNIEFDPASIKITTIP
jgi:hypothetical protein